MLKIENIVRSRSYYRWLVVGLLLVAYTLSFIDRQIISLLVEPIRKDLAISDTQISLLQGLAFALFYTFMGIPIAKLADKRSRRNIIVAGLVCWSLMTAFCGISKHYWTLFAGRLGVGVGEAALSPASYSMISDYFAANRLSTALSIYGAGPYIGSGLAYILGGATIDYIDKLGQIIIPFVGIVANWQAAFIVVGLPGVMVAVFIILVVREPDRVSMVEKKAVDNSFFSDVIPYIFSNARFYVCHAVGMGFIALVTYSAVSWIPTYFVRVYDLPIAKVARDIGILVLIFGTLGIILGGRFSDYLQNKKDRIDGTMRSVWIATIFIAPAAIGSTLGGSVNVSYVFVGFLFLTVSFPFGAGVAALQMATPPHFRAQVSAVYLFVNNVIGLAAGPTAVALLTDYFFKDDTAVGKSLAIVCSLGGCLSCALCYFTLNPLREMLKENLK